MLTNSDLKLNFLNFRLCSLLSIYPIHFRRFEDGASREQDLWRKLLFKFWQGLTSCHISYMILRTAYAALFTNPNWEILALLIFLIICFGSFVIFMLILLEKNLGLNLKVYNEVIEIRDELFSFGVREKIRPVELVLCHSFTLLSSGLIIYPILYALDMDALYLIISLVPVNWRNPGVIVLCLIMEMIPHIVYLLWLNYAMYIILSFVLSFEQYATWNITNLDKLENPTISAEEPIPESDSDLKIKSVVKISNTFLIESQIMKFCIVLNRLNLYLKFFKLGISKALFVAKQLCLIISIGGGFLAIKLMRTRPELALMYFLIHLYCMTFHTAIFSLAYGVKTSGNEMKRVMLLTSRLLRLEGNRQSMKKQIKAVTRFDVSVGGFYFTQRESVLIFMDFVFQQIVGLLVSF